MNTPATLVYLIIVYQYDIYSSLLQSLSTVPGMGGHDHPSWTHRFTPPLSGHLPGD